MKPRRALALVTRLQSLGKSSDMAQFFQGYQLKGDSGIGNKPFERLAIISGKGSTRIDA